MRKIIFFLAATFLFALDWSGKVNWAMSYDLAKQLAKKQNKLIIVDVSLTNCPPCKYLATKVYTNNEVTEFINKNFIPVFYLAYQDTLPVEVQNYFTGSTPTIMFIKPNGELIYSFIGARPPKVFLEILKTVKEKYKDVK